MKAQQKRLISMGIAYLKEARDEPDLSAGEVRVLLEKAQSYIKRTLALFPEESPHPVPENTPTPLPENTPGEGQELSRGEGAGHWCKHSYLQHGCLCWLREDHSDTHCSFFSKL